MNNTCNIGRISSLVTKLGQSHPENLACTCSLKFENTCRTNFIGEITMRGNTGCIKTVIDGCDTKNEIAPVTTYDTLTNPATYIATTD